MQNDQEYGSTPQKIALVRQIFAPALKAGLGVRTAGGRSVTLDDLAGMVAEKEKLQMVGQGGELIAVTLSDGEVPDTPRTHEQVPSFRQVHPSGEEVRFFLFSPEFKGVAISTYVPALLDLSLPILDVRLCEAKCIHRTPAKRAERIFRGIAVFD
jgi:hypothetical protein